MPSQRLFLYALDVKPRLLFQLRISLESVRRFDRETPIHIAIFGDGNLTDIDVETLGATVHRRPHATGLYVKWEALATVAAEGRTVVFLDCDTCLLAHPNGLFAQLDDADFAARVETKARRPAADVHETCQVSYHVFDDIVRTIGGVPGLPVFNTGVMLFSPAGHDKLRAGIATLWRMRDAFRRKVFPYPSQNPHISEEVVGALLLSALPAFRCRVISPSRIPFLVEHALDAMPPDAVIVHTWSVLYPTFLQQRGDAAAVAEYARLDPQSRMAQAAATARRRAVGVWLQLGSSTAARSLLTRRLWMRFAQFRWKARNQRLPAGIGR